MPYNAITACIELLYATLTACFFMPLYCIFKQQQRQQKSTIFYVRAMQNVIKLKLPISALVLNYLHMHYPLPLAP